MIRGAFRYAAALSLVAIMLAVSACGGTKPASTGEAEPAAVTEPAPVPTVGKVPLKARVGYLPVMDDAQVMLAYDGGFFQKQSLDAELLSFGSGTDLIKAIVGGQLDAGVLGFTNAISWAARGADLKIVAGAQMGYHSILVRKGSGIRTVADLKGKRLASQQKGSTADIVLNGVVLPQAGLSVNDLQMVYVSPAVAIQSLAAGQVDAAFVFEPYEQIAQVSLDVEAIYEVGKVWPFPCMVVITSGKLLAENRELINRVLAAQEEAIEMLRSDPRRSAELIRHYFIAEESIQTPRGPVSAVDLIQKAIETQMFHWELTPAEVARMQEGAQLMFQQGLLEKPFDVTGILDLSWQQNRGQRTMASH
jgi:NitT/TauT family transport system substrate-binding protein